MHHNNISIFLDYIVIIYYIFLILLYANYTRTVYKLPHIYLVNTGRAQNRERNHLKVVWYQFPGQRCFGEMLYPRFNVAREASEA